MVAEAIVGIGNLIKQAKSIEPALAMELQTALLVKLSNSQAEAIMSMVHSKVALSDAGSANAGKQNIKRGRKQASKHACKQASKHASK